MTPWELRKATDDLRDAWNELHAQVVGRSMTGRAEMSDALKNEIAAARSGFRQWYDGLIGRPLEEAFGLYSAEYQNQLAIYRKVAAKSAQSLKAIGEKPKYSALDQWVERPSGFLPGVVIGAGLLVLGWYLINKQKKR